MDALLPVVTRVERRADLRRRLRPAGGILLEALHHERRRARAARRVEDCATSTGASVRCAASVRCGVRPANGGCPVSSSYAMQPSE